MDKKKLPRFLLAHSIYS